MIALLLAAALTSAPVGEFHVVPSWMYTGDVSSEMTPGSDDWYVDGKKKVEFVPTNVVVKFAKVIRLKGSNEPVDSSQDVTGDLLGDAVLLPNGNLDISKCVAPPAKYGTDLGRYEARGVWQWVGEPSDWYSGNAYYVYHGYGPLTYVTNGVNYVHTNIAARATRLMPEMHASVLSTFEAYFERMYYASAGKDVAENPLGALKDVEFPLYYDPTNRVVTSRRLSMHQNIDRLANKLQYMFRNGMSDEYSKSPARENEYAFLAADNWMAGANRISYDSPGRMFWSTTAEPFGSMEAFPTFGWTTDLSPIWESEIFQRQSRAPIFGELYGVSTDGYSGWWINFKQYYSPSLWSQMLDAVMLGPGDESYTVNVFRDTGDDRKLFEAGVPGLIESNYCGAVHLGITNHTHRLRSERLCEINQFLGLMDRTIEMPKIDYPGRLEHIVFNNKYSGYGTGSIDVTISFENYDVNVMTNSVIEIGGFQDVLKTNSVERTEREHSHVRYAIREHTPIVGVGGGGESVLYELRTDEDSVRYWGAAGLAPGETYKLRVGGDLTYDIWDGTILFWAGCEMINEWGSFEGQLQIGGDYTQEIKIPVELNLTAYMDLGYDAERTIEENIPKIGPLNGYSRVKSAAVTFLLGMSSVDFELNHFNAIEALDGCVSRFVQDKMFDKFTFREYASERIGYRTPAELESLVRSEYQKLIDKCKDRVTDEIGCDIDNYERLIPVGKEFLAEKLKPESFTISANAYLNCEDEQCEVIYTIVGDQYGNPQVVKTETWMNGVKTSQDGFVPVLLGMLIVSVDARSNAESLLNHFGSHVSEGCLGVMTEHIWDWKHLKRKDNK